MSKRCVRVFSTTTQRFNSHCGCTRTVTTSQTDHSLHFLQFHYHFSRSVCVSNGCTRTLSFNLYCSFGVSVSLSVGLFVVAPSNVECCIVRSIVGTGGDGGGRISLRYIQTITLRYYDSSVLILWLSGKYLQQTNKEFSLISSVSFIVGRWSVWLECVW